MLGQFQRLATALDLTFAENSKVIRVEEIQQEYTDPPHVVEICEVHERYRAIWTEWYFGEIEAENLNDIWFEQVWYVSELYSERHIQSFTVW